MHLNVRDTSEERVNRCNIKDRLTLSRCPRCKYKMVQSVNIHSIDGIQIAYYLMKEEVPTLQRTFRCCFYQTIGAFGGYNSLMRLREIGGNIHCVKCAH